jgi:hypothetical protein
VSPIYLASGVVAISCIAFVVVGTAYKWDVISTGYGRWTRIVGVTALMGVAITAVWDRLHEPVVVFAAVVVGATLSAAFVWAHRLLSCRLRAAAHHEDPERECDSPQVRP